MENIDAIIQALGGRQAIAERFEITASAVGKWKKNGIPTKHWRDIVSRLGISYEDLEAFHPDNFKPEREAA